MFFRICSCIITEHQIIILYVSLAVTGCDFRPCITFFFYKSNSVCCKCSNQLTIFTCGCSDIYRIGNCCKATILKLRILTCHFFRLCRYCFILFCCLLAILLISCLCRCLFFCLRRYCILCCIQLNRFYITIKNGRDTDIGIIINTVCFYHTKCCRCCQTYGHNCN